MTARTRPRIPLSEEERDALALLRTLVRLGVLPRNPALLARLEARLAA